jgi:hypothetical protein
MPLAPPPDSKFVCARTWPTGKRCGWRGQADELIRVRAEGGRRAEVCPRCRSADHLVEACAREGCWRQYKCVYETPDFVVRACPDHFAELKETARPRYNKAGIGPREFLREVYECERLDQELRERAAEILRDCYGETVEAEDVPRPVVVMKADAPARR